MFENYPCTLAKIFGAFVLSVSTNKSQKEENKYILLQENLNLGITASEEKNIVRYDLKGSEMKRFVN